MARMIPPHISPDCKSPGEKLLFQRFLNDPATSDWIVIHSLGIAKHSERLSGEIDFIVIVPGQGVLCIEVKAGSVKRKEGFWVMGSGSSLKKTTIGPFKQASDGMHAVRKYLAKADPALSKILMYSGVLFTYIDFNEESPEWHKWQYADRTRLLRTPVSEVCNRMLQYAHVHSSNTPSATWYDTNSSRPDKIQSLKIASILRGDFECFCSVRSEIEETEREIMSFTNEQYLALDALEFNERLLFSGPAGTGKTFLALETARRSVLSEKKTLLICFNRLLAQWLDIQTKTLQTTYQQFLTTGTLHKILKTLAQPMTAPDYSHEYWNMKLPKIVVDKILNNIISAPQYDMIIIDEAQDLLKENFLDVIDLLLEGGLSGGRWAMFGDFERQAIYSQPQVLKMSTDKGKDILKKRSPNHFIYPLRTNCRNTKKISVGLEVACKLDPRYAKILHTESGADIEIAFYHDMKEQKNQIAEHLTSLRKIYTNNEIIILSPKENIASCAEQLSKNNPSLKLKPLVSIVQENSVVGYTTIQGYKGLEAPAVILSDIEELEGAYAEALLYIGMSRARINLVLIMHEKCREKYLKINEQGLKLIMGGQSGRT